MRKIERAGEVTADLPAPGAEVRNLDTSPEFEELEDRRMIENLRADTSTAGPGRNDDGGHADAQTNGRTSNKFIRCARWRENRHGMIEEAVVLVEMENKYRRFIDLRIGGEAVQ